MTTIGDVEIEGLDEEESVRYDMAHSGVITVPRGALAGPNAAAAIEEIRKKTRTPRRRPLLDVLPEAAQKLLARAAKTTGIPEEELAGMAIRAVLGDRPGILVSVILSVAKEAHAARQRAVEAELEAEE